MALIEFKNKPDLTTPITADALNHNFNELLNKSISESGTNSNGTYVKFTDGTMICYNKQTFNTSITTPSGALFISNNLNMNNYPASFTELPAVTLNVVRLGSSYPFSAYKTSESTLTKPPTIRIANSEAVTSSLDYIVDYVSIGRWK